MGTITRALFAGAVVGLIAYLLGASWLRWVDPQIDFGREVYLPWRILQGDQLGRDFVHPYGPLSVYGNAALMAVFGVSVRTLVFANLVVFGGIVLCLHVVLRRAFGFLPAAGATLVGVAVFGFAHYWGINNYTYAAPYSHEASHGMLLLLLLLVWLGRTRVARSWRWQGAVAGGLIGLCCLTKTEYVFASALVGVLAGVNWWRDPANRSGALTGLAWGVGGCGAVFALAVAGLMLVLPTVAAVRLTGNALLAPFAYADYSRSAHVLHFLGADNLAANVQTLVTWGGGTLGVLALVIIAGRGVARLPGRWVGGVYIGGAMVLAGVEIGRIPWVFCGTVFPVLLAAAAVHLGLKQRARPVAGPGLRGRFWNQALGLTAAVAMLGRMAFDPTISHYGFYQALLAGTWLAAYLIGEWPGLAGGSRVVRGGLRLAVVLCLGGGAVQLVRTSQHYYDLKSLAIGEGADRVQAYRPQTYALPEFWEQARGFIAAHSAPDSSLLVIPEGISLNYWTRRRHPLRITDVLPATLKLNRGDVVAELAAHPPQTVVLVSRPNMEELGFKAYGQDAASGKAIVDWVRANYALVAQGGADPLVAGGIGLRIYQRKAAAD